MERNRIVSTPGTCGGKPRIDGTRIRVQDIVMLREKLSPDRIVAEYPSLSLEDIEAAMEYYENNPTQIDGDIRESRDFVEQLRLKNPSKLDLDKT